MKGFADGVWVASYVICFLTTMWTFFRLLVRQWVPFDSAEIEMEFIRMLLISYIGMQGAKGMLVKEPSA